MSLFITKSVIPSTTKKLKERNDLKDNQIFLVSVPDQKKRPVKKKGGTWITSQAVSSSSNDSASTTNFQPFLINQTFFIISMNTHLLVSHQLCSFLEGHGKILANTIPNQTAAWTKSTRTVREREREEHSPWAWSNHMLVDLVNHFPFI